MTDPLAKLKAAIEEAEAAGPAILTAAQGLVGKRVVVTSYTLGGSPYEKSGTLVRIEPWAQYSWSLVLRPPRKRTHMLRYRPDNVLAIREETPHGKR